MIELYDKINLKYIRLSKKCHCTSHSIFDYIIKSFSKNESDPFIVELKFNGFWKKSSPHILLIFMGFFQNPKPV